MARTTTALAVVVAALAAPVTAQNLLSNPEIASTIAPWTVCGISGGGGPLFDDYTLCPDSGSIAVFSSQVDCDLGYAASYHQVAFRQCVPLAGTGVTPGASEVYYRGLVSFSASKEALLAIAFFSSDDCTGDGIDLTSTAMIVPAFAWKELQLSPAFTVPADAASVEYRLSAVDVVNNSIVVATFDHAYLGTVPLLYADGFEHGSSAPCSWSASTP